MKKMLVVSFLLTAALVAGCSKKNAQTTPPTNTPTDPAKEGGEAGGATYGGANAPDGAAPADPCAAPN